MHAPNSIGPTYGFLCLFSVIAAVVKVWRPLSISRSLLRAWAIYFVNLGLHCLGVAGGLWDTRSVSPPFNPPSQFRDSPVSNAVFPSRRFQFILRCSFHCAHFIVLISLCSFPRWQLDIGRDLLGSHCFSAKITQPLFTSLLHPNDRSVQWVWSSIFTVSCHVFSVSRTNSVFHVVACVIASRKPAVSRTAHRREIAFGESTLPHMEGI